ncbi:hypothetical protein EDB89DRAFT_1913683 [Lactarius sanguifluus]|nr:hypothetical protein EDB89DRAFT_1913683 [Lactarius sanguifluus]
MVWGRRKWTCIVGGLELAGQRLWLRGVGGVAVCAVVDYWVYTEDEAESCTSHVPKPQQRQRSNEPQGLKLYAPPTAPSPVVSPRLTTMTQGSTLFQPQPTRQQCQ